jgi:hypothetical protein
MYEGHVRISIFGDVTLRSSVDSFLYIFRLMTGSIAVIPDSITEHRTDAALDFGIVTAPLQ